MRQKGNHIRMQKRSDGDTLKITIPAHKPIKRSTLFYIIKSAGLSLEEF
ncbi:MAG: type II toxin-antitoxin system HicA family toxin [Candidatus Thermoplasmatota archaeon]|nr:type II toxin-antitoxin system HicA family toxin [Candidatus Thermoplasmatota archaeon]